MFFKEKVRRYFGEKWENTKLFSTSGSIKEDYGLYRALTVDGFDADNYFSQVEDNYRNIANPFAYYRELIERLKTHRNINLCPMKNLFSAHFKNHINLALRHDIDADPLTALRCARFLARFGIPGSFYLLHTARYYGVFVGDYFVRNPQVRDWVLGLIVAGAEIGLHNDALGISKTYRLNGVQFLKNELDWLRDLGANVYGTVAHNSGPIYGAENFEIFSDSLLFRRNSECDPGFHLPLGLVAKNEWGLTYEGIFAVPKPHQDTTNCRLFFDDIESASLQNERWVRAYLYDNPCMEYLVDLQCWLVGPDTWIVSGKPRNNIFLWNVNIDEVLRVINKMLPGERIVLVIHPEYVRH